MPTNNVSERALRPVVLWRRGSFGSDSDAGSRFAERLLTVSATCRQQGRRLLDFLVAAGEAGLQGTAAPSLLPARQVDRTLRDAAHGSRERALLRRAGTASHAAGARAVRGART